MTSKKPEILKAINEIKSIIEKKFSNFLYNDEIDAIVTHFIFAPEIKPASMPEEIYDYLLKEFFNNKTNNSSEESLYVKEEQATYAASTQLVFPFVKEEIPFPPPQHPDFKFIDLFAGIGGFRIALQNLNGKCVFSSEWDKAAKQTYFNNFGEIPYGDINQFTNENISDEELDQLIPDHDVLCAGFPCQPFSHAGVSARTSLGQKHGFEDRIQGTLFFNIARIVKVKKPQVLFLENVKGLVNHDKGKTFKAIKETIENHLGYSFQWKVINSNTEVPQSRKRCYMICFLDSKKEFSFPKFTGEPIPLKTILEQSPDKEYTISDKLWAGHQRRTARNLERGTGFTAFTADINKPSNTIVARYGKDGKECLIPQKGKNPRKLTPRECAKLQGFPKEFLYPEAKTPAYKQFGNSVAIPVIQKIAGKILNTL
jgi:DNA (cytosine-5)-methyltransferase 1